MKKLFAIFLTSMIFALPAMAGGEKCTASGEECVTAMKTKLANKPWLGIEYDKVDSGRWSVKKVFPNSPAEQAGFQAGDILIAMQGVDYSKDNKTAIKAVYADLAPGSDVNYVVKRNGSKVKLDATLAHVPSDLQKKWLAEYIQQNHPELQVASTD